MSKRKKTILIIILAIIVIIIAVAIYFLFFRKPATTPLPETQDQFLETESDEPQIIQSSTGQTPETATPTESEYGRVKNLATSFAERFGSYSNQSNCQNLEELKIFMTQKMKNWADNIINSCNQASDDENYSAQTTKALSTKEDFYNSELGQAEFTIQTQRQEFIGSPENPSTYYQDIKITLIKQASEWKVDSAYWQ